MAQQNLNAGDKVEVTYNPSGADQTFIGVVDTDYPAHRPIIQTDGSLLGNVTLYLNEERVIERGGRKMGKLVSVEKR